MIQTCALSVFAGAKTLLRNISIRVESRQVFGIIGPSGAGKSTLLRCLNRLIELDAGLTAFRTHGLRVAEGRAEERS
jgi:ABC-type phosphate transport system ATPase subunit